MEPSHSADAQRETEVVISRDFEASAEQVFDAWLNADAAGRWLFATPDGEMQTVEIDPRVGGTFRFVDKRGDELADHFGTYVELDRPRRLAFTFASSREEKPSRVSIEIVPLQVGCELKLTHEVLPEWAGFVDQTRAGWTMILDGLASTLADSRALVLTRVFDAPRERVWEAWTDPRQLAQWSGPRGFTAKVTELDLKPGGGWRYVMIGPDGTEYPAKGVYREIVPGERIVTTDEFDEGFEEVMPVDLPSGIVLTTFFEDVNGSTKLTLRIMHATAADRRKHEQMGVVAGWNSSFDCLAEHLAKVTS